jgi:hypothetical protein
MSSLLADAFLANINLEATWDHAILHRKNDLLRSNPSSNYPGKKKFERSIRGSNWGAVSVVYVAHLPVTTIFLACNYNLSFLYQLQQVVELLGQSRSNTRFCAIYWSAWNADIPVCHEHLAICGRYMRRKKMIGCSSPRTMRYQYWIHPLSRLIKEGFKDISGKFQGYLRDWNFNMFFMCSLTFE